MGLKLKETFVFSLFLSTCVVYGLQNMEEDIVYSSKEEESYTVPLNFTYIREKRSPPASTHWSILISEFNSDSPKPPPSLFIEIRIVYTSGRHGPVPKNKFKDYYLLIIQANPPQVVFYLDLGSKNPTVRDRALFFVIGDEGLENVDLPFNDAAINSIYKHDEQSRPLNDGSSSPFAIILLYAKGNRKAATNMNLIFNHDSQQYMAKPVTTQLLADMKPLIVDMVVYGKKVHASHCNMFDALWPEKFAKQIETTYILRDWDLSHGIDYSLNRCATNDYPFQPESFRYGRPTPGQLNDCDGPSFLIENVIDRLALLLAQKADPPAGCSVEHGSISPGRYMEIDEESLEELREEKNQNEDEPPIAYGPLINTADVSRNIAKSNAKILEMGGTAISKSLIGHSTFNPHWIEIAKDYLPNDAAMLTQSYYQKWVRVNSPGSNNRPISFYCDACVMHFEVAKLDVRNKKAIMTKDGYFTKDPGKNAKQIKEHGLDPYHLAAEAYSLQLAEAKTEDEIERLKNEEKQKVTDLLQPTVNMMKTVFTEVLAETPFSNHELFVTLQQDNGVNLGFMYGGAYGAKLMVESMSKSMHKLLLEYLVSEKKPFSLIVDATTTTRNVPYLNTYIQTLEDGYPINYYYRFIELVNGEAAIPTFNEFKVCVEKDDVIVPGFKDFVHTKLAFFVSDNAAVMVGPRRSFLTLLSSELKRDIPSMGCYAHKLSLVIKAAIRDSGDSELEYVTVFEKNLNELYIFYNSRGSKRFQHFKETAEEYNISPQRFKKNIVVRWAAAEEKVVATVLANRDLADIDLKKIHDDVGKEFLRPVREQAAELRKSITDTTSILLYHEFADFLTINKILSQSFQERAGTLIDHTELITKVIESYEKLMALPGPQMKAFMKTCECKELCWEECTIEELETCPSEIVCADFTFGNYIEKNFKLYKTRYKIYEKMLAAFNKYFNMDLIKALDLFNNRNFIAFSNVDSDYCKQQFKTVCVFVKYDEAECDIMHDQFVSLVAHINEISEHKKNFDAVPSKFWPLVLNDPNLYISSQLVLFFEKLLVMSDSSAESERGFSIMTRILQGERSSLQHNTLDSLLRIRTNAAKSVKDIKIITYAQNFVNEKFSVDDPTQEYRKRPSSGNTKRQAVRVSRLF